MVKRPPKALVAEREEQDRLVGLAHDALLEVTSAARIGAFVETRAAGDGLTDVVFEPGAEQRGYTGWHWIVTIARVTDEETGEALAPTVLELGLLPGEGALLAPEWVPWSVRLAEWKAQQAAAAAEAGEDADDLDDEDGAAEQDGDDFDDAEALADDDLDDADLDDADLDDEDPEEGEEADEDPDADDEDDFEDDEGTEGLARTHGGDIDGVDIDALDTDEV